jgi:hypothetical protein
MLGMIKVERDFINGVTSFKDKNYNPYCNGVTKQSLNFFDYLLEKGFFETKEVYRVDLKFSKKHWYSLTLYTIHGYSFSFYGCSFGYGGEGSRGSKYILDKCGFSKTDRVFKHKNHFEQSDMMRFFKRIK